MKLTKNEQKQVEAIKKGTPEGTIESAIAEKENELRVLKAALATNEDLSLLGQIAESCKKSRNTVDSFSERDVDGNWVLWVRDE